MDPTSNNNTKPPDYTFWGNFKRNYLQSRSDSNIPQIVKGAFLGGWTTMLLNPGLYAVNMAMLKQKIVWRDSFRGVGLNGANVVPQMTVQVTLYNTLRKFFYPNIEDQDLTFGQKLVCSGGAGYASGMVTATGEMAVLNYQKQKVVTQTVKQIIVKAYNAGGITRCNTGAQALGGRELFWTISYSTLTKTISALYCSIIPNQHASDVLGAATAGGIGGVLTNPLNYLRAQKQNEALGALMPRSYWVIITDAGVPGLFRGVMQRMLVTSVACVIITEGKKVFDRLLEE